MGCGEQQVGEEGLGVSHLQPGPFPLCLSGPQMILFSACCICGLIGGILNFQFVRALSKRPDALSSVHLAAMTMACLGKSPRIGAQPISSKLTASCSVPHLISNLPGITSCTLSTWLMCRLASSEQQRMFHEREHSLHHSHEMTEKVEALTEDQRRGVLLDFWELSVCAPLCRRSWTTPVAALRRFPTTGTQRKHRDSEGLGAAVWRSPAVRDLPAPLSCILK